MKWVIRSCGRRMLLLCLPFLRERKALRLFPALRAFLSVVSAFAVSHSFNTLCRASLGLDAHDDQNTVSAWSQQNRSSSALNPVSNDYASSIVSRLRRMSEHTITAVATATPNSLPRGLDCAPTQERRNVTVPGLISDSNARSAGISGRVSANRFDAARSATTAIAYLSIFC